MMESDISVGCVLKHIHHPESEGNHPGSDRSASAGIDIRDEAAM